jgi:hypothetical protein
MDNFQTEYLHLLRLQVDDEIKFLVDNGHNSKSNFKPCMFCYETKAGSYSCNRLGELRQFQSSIAVANTRQITHERRGIGFEPKAVDTTQLELPQLMQPF